MVTRPDAPAGRGRKLVASPVAQRAEELGVPVLKPDHPRDPDFQEALRALAPDCCPVVAYGALLPQSALDIPEHGWVNLHFSVLPAWRGAAPVQHAIWAGDEVTGATTFRIVKELDAGPTFGLMTQTIRPDDTAGDLLERLAEGGAGLLVQTLDGIEDGTLEAREQPAEGRQLRPEDHRRGRPGRLDRAGDRGRPADPRLHARRPAPGRPSAGERIKLGPVRPVGRERLEPGLLEVTKNDVFVGTATGPVRLGRVKPFGKKEMDAADWARGVHVPRRGHAGVGEPTCPTPRTSTRSAAACPRPGSAPPGATCRPGWCRCGSKGDKGRGFVLYRKPHKTAVDPETGELYDDLLVIRTANADDKQALVDGDGPFFTIDHFNGFNAVLVQQSRLGEVTREELAEVITDAWVATAPKKLVKEFLA